MKRREFIAVFAGAAASSALLPNSARAQQPALPVVGFLRGSPAEGSAHIVAAFRQGLKETGYVEGQNVAVEFRWADGHSDQLPALAADLVRRKVTVILASATASALAAKSATSAIPIVFVMTVDPVKAGLVASLNRPGGNATGISYLTSALGGKRLEFLQQMAPATKAVAVLLRPDNPATEPLLRDLETGAAVLGLRLIVQSVTNERDLENTFVAMAQQQPGALVVGPDPLFTSRSAQIVALAARYALPAIYTTADSARAGGLMAWGISLTEQYRVAGTYVGKILNGAKPSELPVLRPTKYDLVINLKTAKALGIDVPAKLLALADEVIE
jgi:putative ABC transport system substrate-binding protein